MELELTAVFEYTFSFAIFESCCFQPELDSIRPLFPRLANWPFRWRRYRNHFEKYEAWKWCTRTCFLVYDKKLIMQSFPASKHECSMKGTRFKMKYAIELNKQTSESFDQKRGEKYCEVWSNLKSKEKSQGKVKRKLGINEEQVGFQVYKRRRYAPTLISSSA